MRKLNFLEIASVAGGWDSSHDPLRPPVLPGNPTGWEQGREDEEVGPDSGDVVNVLQGGVLVDLDGDGVMDFHFAEGQEIYGDDTDGNGYVDWFEDGWANGQGNTADFDGIKIWNDNIS